MSEKISDKIHSLSISGVRITPKTSWIFVTLVSENGLTGIGEATLSNRDAEVVAAAREYSHRVLEADIEAAVASADGLQTRLPFADLAQAAFSSAVLQALWDLHARAHDLSLAAALGGVRRRTIPIYANINRRTLDRSPAGFAASAAGALAAGYRALKIAPFDGLTPGMETDDAAAAFGAGLRRIEAVRECVGDGVRLMIDCHWRFDHAGAVKLIDAVSEIKPYWIECPIAETRDNLDALRALRAGANARGIRLAGCETAVLRRGFEPFLEAGAYDVMMPDVKYAGGPAEMLRIAERFAEYNIAFSPHNPSGPICHAATLQVCAAVDELDILELQWDETPLFAQLVAGELAPVTQGMAQLPPAQVGMGLSLDESMVQALEKTESWSIVPV